jgi:DNA-binding transcriptional LysR family regulator
MELKKLRYFVSVATLQNFTAAAKALNTVQPAISRQIADLEAELGAKLLIRNTREVTITPAGQYLLAQADRMFALEQEILTRVKQIDKGEIGQIRVGYLGSASFSFIGELVKRFTQQFPNVKIQLFELTSQEQITAFENDDIDIGFSRKIPSKQQRGLISEQVFEDKLVVVVPENHQLSQRQSVTITELVNENIILLSRLKAMGLFNKIIDLFRVEQLAPQITSQPQNMQTLLTEVSANFGIGIAPACIRRLYTYGCCFIPLANEGTTVPLEVHYPENTTNAVVKEFVNLTIKHKTLIKQLSS